MKQSTNKPSSQRNSTAITPEAREDEMIALAVDLAEQKLRDGTAGTQIVVHYLKLASTKDRLEKEILEAQKKLIVAKTEAIESAKRVEELYTNAMAAMKSYSGQDDEYED